MCVDDLDLIATASRALRVGDDSTWTPCDTVRRANTMWKRSAKVLL